MKMRLVILISAIAARSSCGAAGQYASSGQKYQDGIYYRPEQSLDKTERVPDETVENLIARSEETSLLLFGDRKDTVIIPDSKSAVIHLDGEEGTTITITDDPFTDIYYSTYPWTYYSPAYVSVWGSPWYYRSWVHYYDPWYWGSWYYDPWFWGVTGVFWDPWFCNPWFWGAPHLPYNPYWDHGHHHHPGPGHISGAGNGHYYGHRTSGSSSVRQYVSRGNSGQTTVSGGRSTVRRASGVHHHPPHLHPDTDAAHRRPPRPRHLLPQSGVPQLSHHPRQRHTRPEYRRYAEAQPRKYPGTLQTAATGSLQHYLHSGETAATCHPGPRQ